MTRIESIAARGLDLILRAVCVGCLAWLVCITCAIINGAVEACAK